MIEHPEAITIAGQIAETLTGKRIQSAMRGNAPHKWAFYSRPAEEYAALLQGQQITDAKPSGSLILIHTAAGPVVVLGGGGERIQYHPPEDAGTEKHQLLLRFDDATFLTVKVQGKENFLGGSIYYCPACQEPPPKPTRRSRKPKSGR